MNEIYNFGFFVSNEVDVEKHYSFYEPCCDSTLRGSKTKRKSDWVNNVKRRCVLYGFIKKSESGEECSEHKGNIFSQNRLFAEEQSFRVEKVKEVKDKKVTEGTTDTYQFVQPLLNAFHELTRLNFRKFPSFKFPAIFVINSSSKGNGPKWWRKGSRYNNKGLLKQAKKFADKFFIEISLIQDIYKLQP